MTVSVADRMIQTPSQLSDVARLALTFIDGGVQWLAWAASATLRYDFPDETALIGGTQQGLHQTRLTWLPTLGVIVSPVKLMTLGADYLRALARVEGGDRSDLSLQQAQTALTAGGLVTQSALKVVPQFLAGLGVGSAPLLQFLNLGEALAMFEFATAPQTSAIGAPIAQEAAAFALQQARAPLEFIDYFQFYQVLATRLTAPLTSPDQRQQAITATMAALLPLCFRFVDCPQVRGLVPPAVVAETVRNWLRQGRQIGFSRVSQAASQVALSTSLTTETGTAIQTLVTSYERSAQAFLLANPTTRGDMAQDGAMCLFPIQTDALQAQLVLAESGDITLQFFRKLNDGTF